MMRLLDDPKAEEEMDLEEELENTPFGFIISIVCLVIGLIGYVVAGPIGGGVAYALALAIIGSIYLIISGKDIIEGFKTLGTMGIAFLMLYIFFAVVASLRGY